MSVTSAAERISAIEALVGRVTTPPVGAAGFDVALASAASWPEQPASAAAGATPYAAEIDAAAARNGVDPAVLRGLIRQESGFNPMAGSPAGAQGLAQLMPGTAAALGVSDPFDPAQSIDGGARYLRQQLERFGGDVQKALAAYNAGPGAVERFGGIPPYAETQGYVRKVMAYAEEYRASGGALAPPPGLVTTTPGATSALPYPTV